MKITLLIITLFALTIGAQAESSLSSPPENWSWYQDRKSLFCSKILRTVVTRIALGGGRPNISNTIDIDRTALLADMAYFNEAFMSSDKVPEHLKDSYLSVAEIPVNYLAPALQLHGGPINLVFRIAKEGDIDNTFIVESSVPLFGKKLRIALPIEETGLGFLIEGRQPLQDDLELFIALLPQIEEVFYAKVTDVLVRHLEVHQDEVGIEAISNRNYSERFNKRTGVADYSDLKSEIELSRAGVLPEDKWHLQFHVAKGQIHFAITQNSPNIKNPNQGSRKDVKSKGGSLSLYEFMARTTNDYLVATYSGWPPIDLQSFRVAQLWNSLFGKEYPDTNYFNDYYWYIDDPWNY